MKSVESNGVWTIYGKSTDVKPSGDEVAAKFENQPVIFYEMDTTNAFMYDYDTHTWLPQ